MPSRRSHSAVCRRIEISRFSAFNEVNLTLGAITILTGPQASGKSLVCKLTYFFQEVFDEILRSIQDGQSFSQFSKNQAIRFAEWFPPSAWGTGKFRILYEVEGFSIEVVRSSGRGALKETVNLRYSQTIETLYEEIQSAFELSKRSVSREEQLAYIRSDQNYRFNLDFYRAVHAQFGRGLTSSQTYVPASRAFFTTIGKAMSAFEHGQLLDPITKSFGRLYIGLSERMRHGFPLAYRYSPASSSSGPRYRNTRMSNIFGGRPKIERNEMVIESPDGRLIPLFALSSGQQELLPLWLSLDYFESTVEYLNPAQGANFLYIEEPEAHLFPEAQSGVLEVLASLLKKKEARAQMVLTTHSPYLLAKANNLLLAGKLGYRKRLEKQKKVDAVIPRSRWLLPSEVSCYGLVDGNSVNLIGDDSLISTDYIDAVSQDIVDEHQQLYDAI
jgi:predicted ATPase